MDNKRPVEHVLESAIGVAKGVYAPMFRRHDYEDAMLEIAKREAREGESTAVAFARLCEERDHRVESLFVASRQAEMDEVRKTARERWDAVASGRPTDDVRKTHEGRQAVMDEMNKHAARFRLEGETEERTFSRLLKTDPEMQGLYAKYCRQ